MHSPIMKKMKYDLFLVLKVDLVFRFPNGRKTFPINTVCSYWVNLSHSANFKLLLKFKEL